MRTTLLQNRTDRDYVLRLAAVFSSVSLLALPPALWFGPVSLTFLGASSLIGLLYIFLIFASMIFRDQRWARILWLLAILVITLGSRIITDTLFSIPLRRYFLWPIFIQGLASSLIVFSLTLAFEERLVTMRRGVLICFLLMGIGLLVWYRAEQSNPLVYPTAHNIVVRDDAPPGARKTTFITTASSAEILTFYRQQLERWGWQWTCSTEQSSCRSEITEGVNGPHDVYHRHNDGFLHGPTYEIIVRKAETGETEVEVYDQTRGVPNQFPWP